MQRTRSNDPSARRQIHKTDGDSKMVFVEGLPLWERFSGLGSPLQWKLFR